MITLKKSERLIENAIYKVTLVVEELHSNSEGSYPQYYVILDRDEQEIAYFEPNDLELALEYYEQLDDYASAKANLYDAVKENLVTIWKRDF